MKNAIFYILISLAIIAAFALVLYLMGRYPICECGYIKLWHGVAISPETSQHLTDWYTPSHIIHGFAFYYLLVWLSRKKYPLSLGAMFVIAILLETGWEVFENTNWIIDYYRQNTVSIDYNGDTIINAVVDVLATVIGFFMAHRLPIWAIIASILIMEAIVGFYIRDNLIMNIIMFVYPFESILEWQKKVI